LYKRKVYIGNINEYKRRACVYAMFEDSNSYMIGKPFALQELKPTELTALKTIALEGSLTGYELSKKAKMSERAVYPALQGLKKKAYVECCEVGKTRVGLPKKEYGLTLWGFCNALCLFSMETEILNCVKKWRNLDNVVLMNFDNLKEAFGEKEFLEALKHAASAIARGEHRNSKDERVGNSPFIQKFFRASFFNRLVNFVRIYGIDEHVQNWNLNADVKAWLLEWLHIRKARAEAEISWINRFLKSLEMKR
jgi:DNA-binding PadR family transcriptional regulator